MGTISANAYKSHFGKKSASVNTASSFASANDNGGRSAVKDIVLGTMMLDPLMISEGISKASGKDYSDFQKFAAGYMYVPSKLNRGFFGAAEGITDFLAGGATQIAGAITQDQDVKDAAKWIYKHSWTSEIVSDDLVDREIGNDSTGYKVAGDILNGIGNVAFQIVLAYITGGIGNAVGGASWVSSAAGQATMKGITYGSLFASAAGSGTAEAVQKTGDLGWRENVSGVLKGGVEVATEMISPTGKVIKGAIKGKTAEEGIKYIGKHALAKEIVKNFAEEALEESLSYAGGWYIDNKITKIDNEPFSWKEFFYEGAIGGVAGSLFSTPFDIHNVRVAQSTGKKIYAQGEAYANDKINEGLVVVKELREKGHNSDALRTAEKALMELKTNEKLTLRQKQLYLGLAETTVLHENLADYARGVAETIVERVNRGDVDAQTLSDSINAIVNEAGGEGIYKAADFSDKDSAAVRLYAYTQLMSDFLTPLVGEEEARAFVNDAEMAQEYTGSDEQKNAIRNMQDGERLVFKVGYQYNEGAYGIVYKNGNDYSVAYTTKKQIAEDGTLLPRHHLSLAEAETFFDDMYASTDEIDNAIANMQAEQAVRAEDEQNAKKKAEEAKKAEGKKTEPKKKEATAKKKEQTETKKTAEKKTAEKKTTEKKTKKETVKTEKETSPEDLSEVERKMMPKMDVSREAFTKEEWTQAREAVPNIDNMSRMQQADVLTLVRTGRANGVNETYIKGLCRISAAFNIGIRFSDQLTSKGFLVRSDRVILINPASISETFGHEIWHTIDQDENGAFRQEVIDKVKKIVGEKAFEQAREQYKTDYRAQFGENLSDAELDGEATASVVGKYMSNMTSLQKLAHDNPGIASTILAAVRRMKTKWQTAKAFAKENNSTTFAEYRKMTRIENFLMKELGYNKAVKAKNGTLVEYTDTNGTISYNVRTYREQVIQADGTKKSGREILEARLLKAGYDAEKDVKPFLARLDALADEMQKFGQKYPIQNNWNNTALTYNEETKELVFSSLVSNREYEINFDFSTVCKHREAFTAVLNKLVALGKGGKVNLTPKRIAQINTILKENGFETACKMCFVEGKRNGLKNWATTFVEGRGAKKGWNYYVRKIYGNNVGYASFGTAEATDEDVIQNSGNIEADLSAIAELDETIANRRKNPKTQANIDEKMIRLIESDKRYSFLMKPENLYGTNGVSEIKAKYPEVYSILLQSYGNASPKITLPATPYASEFQNIADKKGRDALAEYTLSIGGARLQSFSDYQMIRFLDYCQLIADGASIGAAMQGYTKEIDMVHLFGLTGMKINMSLVPKLDPSGRGDYAGLVKKADGTWDYAIASESIQPYDSYDEKGNLIRHGAFWYQDQPGYKDNCGTILIGVSKYQILKAMADSNIRMVIPYHKSGLNKVMAEMYGIAGFTDYTNVQHTRRKSDGISIGKEWDFYEAYRRLNGDAKAACQEYIEWCEKNDYYPKFDAPGAKYEGIVFNKDGTMNENYYKLIEDFACYDGDGNVHQQGAVDLVLPDDWQARVKLGLEDAQATATRLDENLDSIINKVLSAKESETNEQIATRNIIAEEQSQKQGMQRSTDVSYSPAPVTRETDSRYLSLARDPQKNESELRRLVKEAAEKAGYNSPLLYHGTPRFGFTVFGTPLIYATEQSAVAANYGGSRDVYAYQRQIGRKWDNSGTIDALIKNAETIYEVGYKHATAEDIADKKKSLLSTASEASQMLDQLYTDFGVEMPDDIRNAYDWVVAAAYDVQEFESEYTNFDELRSDFDKFGGYYETLRAWLVENKNNFSEKGKKYAEYLRSYAFTDAMMDASAYVEMSRKGDYLYWEDRAGEKHFSYADSLRQTVNELHDGGVGAYRLYGDFGNNVLEIDAEGKQWGALDYNGLHTTDEIAMWAKDNGYTSVTVKNVYDGGIKADEHIFFSPNQLKSADPVTYDDSGNIIPLSERFNPQNNDIRYSPLSANDRVVLKARKPRETLVDKFKNGEITRTNFRKAVDSMIESTKVLFVNAQQAVENQLVRNGMSKRQAGAAVQMARSARTHAYNAVSIAFADMNGDVRAQGLLPILEPFLATKGEVCEGYDEKTGQKVTYVAQGGELAGKRFKDFSTYYSTLNAIERANNGKNPYSSVTVAQMKADVAEFEKKNPDFKAAADELVKFNDVLIDIRVQSGLWSQELADSLREKYPHYVPMKPMESNGVGKSAAKGSNNLEVNRGLKTAQESDHRTYDPFTNYIAQIESTIKAAKLNLLLIDIYGTADGVNVVTGEQSQKTAKELRKMERDFLDNPDTMIDPSEMFRKFKDQNSNVQNEVTFYKDGKSVTMGVTDRIYTGVSDLAGLRSAEYNFWVVKAAQKMNDTFKKLVTNWNPFFGIKNIARDLQDGSLQTQHGLFEFLNEYRKNAQMMASGKYNEMWTEFLANGGLESSLFSDEFGQYSKRGKSSLEKAEGIAGAFQHIKNFNTLTEALPRFTEYCLTRKHGGTVQTALLNAADVTVNFGRSGTLTRVLNSTVSPFLNPAVQGMDRVIRLFTENGIKNNKALASLLVKAVLLAVIPMALSNAMYGGDDEYEDMKDSIKENNYLFKIGDTWLKLPRGRVVSTIAGLYNRSTKELMGKDVDWKDYGKNVLDQITPAQNVARHIASPFMDVANNKTWYGSAIESQSLQNYAVKDRYDENTSRISVWIGQFTSHFGLSPKKVNYLLDQYTGVIGDILLPTTTPAGTKGVVSYNFTVDPNTSSNLSTRFYDLYDKTMYASNGGDEEAYYLKKRLDETKSAASELFKQIKTINADSSLSNKEKVKQASAIRAMINQLYKTALQDAKGYSANIRDAMAIENSYAVEQITQKNAKQYGLTSSDAGKYAVTFGGQVVKLYGNESEANEYSASSVKKTVYAEANRLTYGSEYALKEYSSTVYEKAQKLNELGISYDEYYNYYMNVRYYSGADKKQKILAYLKGSGLSKSQVALMMYYSGYTAYADEAKKAIKASSLSAERKKELLAGITN